MIRSLRQAAAPDHEACAPLLVGPIHRFMSGIAGIYAYHYAANAVDRAELWRIRDQMAARGPDGAGEWYSPDERVGLGQCRLAIHDLSERGTQPMASPDGKLAIS